MNEQGPFDRILHQEPSRDRGNRFVVIAIVVLGLLLLILVLPPISILSGGGGGGEGNANISVKARKEMPAPPEGMEAVSPLYDISVSGSIEGPTVITLKLPSVISDPRNLSLYTLEGNQWRRVGSAKLVFDGAGVQGEVSELPKNIAVLRATSALNQLSGSLPAGSELNPQAAEVLSVLNPVDFAPASDGSLEGEAATLPENTGLDIYPTIRVSTAQQAEAANAIIGSPDLRDEHMNAILEMVESGRYRGVDIDYGPLDALHKDEFSEFVVALAEQLHRRGIGLTLTAPLPIQQGTSWDSGAYDWLRLAQAADAIRLLPEEDPSDYYKSMEQALSFLIEQEKIPPAKLVLVLSPWAHEKGGEGIRRLSLLEALTIASTLKLKDEGEIRPGDSVTVIGENIYQEDGASGMGWDEEAAAVSFGYPGLGGARTVWIENSFSIAFRLNLAARFHLGGVAVDDVSSDPGVNDIWPVLQEFAATGKVSLVKPNGTLLLPYWEADGGSLEGGADGAVVWTAPQDPGAYHITLVVSDGLARLGQRLGVTVGE
jgi:hypothetical protein